MIYHSKLRVPATGTGVNNMTTAVTPAKSGAEEIKPRSTSLGRHRERCSVCAHPDREGIERDFLAWNSAQTIAIDYDLADKKPVLRHASAFGLFEKRRLNIRAALECVIEQVNDIQVTSSAVVRAVRMYGKLNALGEWKENRQPAIRKCLLDRMTREELLLYAQDKTLPDWFAEALNALDPLTLPPAQTGPPMHSQETSAAAK